MNRPTNRTKPRQTPTVYWAGLIAVLLLTAAGVAFVQFFASDRGWVQSDPWIRTAATKVDGLHADDWLLTATGVFAMLIGLALVTAALLPARRSHRAAGPSLWVSRPALSAMATDAAGRSPGVSEATTSVSRRAVRVSVVARSTTGDGASGSVSDRVSEAVRERIRDLTDLPVRVQLKEDLS